MSKLERQVALVTGGASGLGRTIAERLAADGATVVITDVDANCGHATASERGFLYLEHDVCDESAWTRVLRETHDRCGALHILVNNAGIVGTPGETTLEATRITDWKNVFAVNVEGIFLGCRAAIPMISGCGGGSIINVSSITAFQATPHAVAYGASKAAVRQLTQSVAQHCAQQRLKIRCNSVHPGIVRTTLWDVYAERTSHARGLSVDAFNAETLAKIPLGDFTLPEDVAATVSFFASGDSRHITGAELVVDGGLVNCSTYRADHSNAIQR